MLEVILSGMALMALSLIALEYFLIFTALYLLKGGVARTVVFSLSLAAAWGVCYCIGVLRDYFYDNGGDFLYAIPAFGLIFPLIRFAKKLDAISEQNSR